jgi:hypothetical protein
LQLSAHPYLLQLSSHRYLLEPSAHSPLSIAEVNNEWRLLPLFLGAFVKLRKVINSIVMSVCPFVRMEELGYRKMDFHEIRYLSIFRKSA